MIGRYMWQESVLRLLDKLQVSKAWSYYQGLILTEFKPEQELRQIQLEKFKKIISHAYENISFYRDKFDQAKIHPRDVLDYSDIRKVPLLSRAELGLLAESLPEDGLFKKNNIFMETSGTTHDPVRVNISKDAVDYKYALLLRHLNRAGWKFGQKVVKFITPQEYYKIDNLAQALKLIGDTFISVLRKGEIKNNDIFRFMHNKLIYELMHRMKMVVYDETAMSFSKNNINKYLLLLKKHNPKLIIARPDFLFLLAKGINRFALKAPAVPTVIVMGNLLTANMSDIIKATFKCSLFDVYGSSELSYVAGSCPEQHSAMHINCESHLVEIISLNGLKAEQSEQGRLVITDFNNYASPLIRYCPGDVGEFFAAECNCGRKLPMLKVSGRDQIIIFDKNNKLLTEAKLSDLISQIIGDTAFKVFYSKNGRTKVHVDADINSERVKQWEDAFRLNDLGFDIDIIRNGSVLAEPSGKFRFIVSADI